MSASIKWISFGSHGKNTRTALHFFPFAGSISATYQADISIKVFGNDLEEVDVVLEGARLSQPDGLFLDEIFPILFENYQGFFGIEVEVNCDQQQVSDLSSSSCIIEIYNTPAQQDPEYPQDEVIRYNASPCLPKSRGVLGQQSGAAESQHRTVSTFTKFADGSEPALIVLNRNDSELEPDLASGVLRSSLLKSKALPPSSLTELQFSNDFIADSLNIDTGRSLRKVQGFDVNLHDNNLAYFLIERDQTTSTLKNVQLIF